MNEHHRRGNFVVAKRGAFLILSFLELLIHLCFSFPILGPKYFPPLFLRIQFYENRTFAVETNKYNSSSWQMHNHHYANAQTMEATP